jgi:hypothetical protein
MPAAGVDDEDIEDANREMFRGKHEWFPTNYLGYVVEWSIGRYTDIRWIYFADVLRIPAPLVVLDPTKVRESAGAAAPLGLQGHVGALHLKGKGKRYNQRIKGEERSNTEDGGKCHIRRQSVPLLDHIRGGRRTQLNGRLPTQRCREELPIAPPSRR